MSITRKTFIKSVSLIAGGVILDVRSFPTFLFRHSGLRELRDNIGIYTEKGGTIGWYVSEDSAAVIDAQFPDTAEHFMDGMKDRIKGNIDFLFNTHHHGDHTSGNYYLKQFTERIVAQENCPELQKKQNKGKENEKQQIYADMTFKDQWQRELGKETINVRHLGPAHTGGDSIIYFEKAGIAHLGDLVFNESYPFIDLAGDGSIQGWIKVLEEASEIYPTDTLYIFGHAASDEQVTGKKADLLKMRDYLLALLEFTKKQTTSGKSIDEVKKAEAIPGFEGRKAKWEGALAANIQAAFDELTGKKSEY